MSSELLCPFCGAEVEPWDTNYGVVSVVECKGCLFFTGCNDFGTRSRCHITRAVATILPPRCWDLRGIALTDEEIALCKLTKARYVSLDSDGAYVILWNGEPRKMLTDHNRCYYTSTRGARDLGTISKALFPSLPAGELLEVPRG